MNFLKIFLAVVFVVSFPLEKKSAQSFSFAGTQYLKRRLRVDFSLILPDNFTEDFKAYDW